MLEEQEIGRQPGNTAIAEMDSEVGDPIIVDAGQVVESIFDAVQEFARFSAVSAIDRCNILL